MTMTMLMMVGAVVMDAGILFVERRHAQAVADAAALAGAADLYANFHKNNGSDPQGTAAQSANDYVTNNYSGSAGTLGTVTVNTVDTGFSSQTLAAHQKPGFIEVILTYNQPRFFSGMFGSGNYPITARAVAEGALAPPTAAVMTLDSSPGVGMSVQNGQIMVNGNGAVISNSSASTRANGMVTTSGAIEVAGTASGNFSPPATTGVPPQPDPFAYLPPPPGPFPPQTPPSGNTITLAPGEYTTDPGGNKNITLQSGTYQFDNGLSTSGNGSIQVASGGGVLLYIAGGSLSLQGNGGITLSPLTTGTYQGMLIFQSRTNTSQMTIGGNGTAISIGGEIYVPDANIKVNGNGSATNLGAGIIADTVTFDGNNSTFNVTFNSGGNNMVGRRVLSLVE
jgi:hypothetical protein